MGIEKIFADEYHQVIKAELPAGSLMAEHYATSEAFVIIVKGKATLIFKDGKYEIEGGNTFLVPARKLHKLEIHEFFLAYIILAPKASIESITEKETNLSQAVESNNF